MQTVDGWKRTAALARSITERVTASGEIVVSDVIKLAKDIAHAEQDVTTALGYVCKGAKLRQAQTKSFNAPTPKPAAKRAPTAKAEKRATAKKAAKPAAKKKASRKR